jgi:hypothetical protein
MKVHVADGGVWWVSKSEEIRAPHGIPMRRVVDAVESTFRFMSTPEVIPKETEALSFREGFLVVDGSEISIKIMELYTNGVHIVTPGDTKFADTILEHTFRLFVEMGMRFPESPVLHFHASEVIFDLDKSIDSMIAGCSAVDALISKHIPHAENVQCAALTFSSDPKSLPPEIAPVNPTVFRIERRAGEAYDDNRYFSFANTTTADHLEILRGLEALL